MCDGMTDEDFAIIGRQARKERGRPLTDEEVEAMLEEVGA